MKNIALFFIVSSLLTVNAQTTENNPKVVAATSNSEIRYYYFPNMEAYYDMENQVFRYQHNKTWMVSPQLPPNYGGYSLYKNERVVLTDYYGDHPEQFIKEHRKQYPYNPKGRIKRPQPEFNDNFTAVLE
ncbi:hypothetical protein [Flavobacterium sedimenticola]|uniref:GLPGLI family protein n=1 Tax=Flavobacterium sedimenticola TaxID=3043286 RepID=A0ABT6XPE0_9FLAO|nr:hypothetical protein [Flavobacterium sedimenticola]MDI9256961.1 hypothetical protein [Flavobacterium sedimenticola]